MRIAIVIVCVLLGSSYLLVAQVKEDIIKKHIAVMGGEKAWQNIKTIHAESVRESGGTSTEEKMQLLCHKAVRNDYIIHSRDEASAQKKYFVLATTEKGWKYMPDNSKDTVLPLTHADANYYIVHSFFKDPFIENDDVKTIDYINKETIEGKDYFKFLVNYKSGMQSYIYMDANSYLITQLVNIGADTETEYYLDDYRKVDKVMIPHKISSNYDELTYKSIEINKAIDEQVFKLK